MTVTLSNELPAYPTFDEGIRRAPDRGYRLTPAQTETALEECTALHSRRTSRPTRPGIYG